MFSYRITTNKGIKMPAYPMETTSVSLWRSTAFFKGVTPYRFCSLEISREVMLLTWDNPIWNRSQFYDTCIISFLRRMSSSLFCSLFSLSTTRKLTALWISWLLILNARFASHSPKPMLMTSDKASSGTCSWNPQ